MSESTKTKPDPELANSGATSFVRKSNRAIDLTGQTFGHLVVLNDSGKRVNKKIMWLCKCLRCDTLKAVRCDHLKFGKVVSCSCWMRDAAIERSLSTASGSAAVKTHGLSRHRVYRVFKTMIARCYTKGNERYDDYGGRGIKVCERWRCGEGFPNFVADMGLPPDGTSIDRRDNDGDYCPENCRWATASEQARNKRSSRYVVYAGETVLLAVLAERVGVPYKELHRRLARGWSMDRAVSQSPREPRTKGKVAHG